MKKIRITIILLISIFSICSAERLRSDYMENINYIYGEDEISAIEWNLEQLQTDLNAHYQPNCNRSAVPVPVTEREYRERLAKLPTVIGMPYNDIVRRYIDVYTSTARRDKMEKILGLASRYFPMFEEELEKAGMPLELKYLPVIESALSYRAYSRAGASGLWQFMVGTGKAYGMTVNTLVDERRDPIKSTQAGVKYLKDLYNIYDDWHLAIAAYNCGPGNVNKAIRRADGKRSYWDIYYFLPKETRGYVPAFIAATYVLNYYPQHNMCPTEPVNIPMNRDTVIVKERLNLQQVAEMLSIPIEDLRAINPQYRKDILPGDRLNGYALCLPTNKIGAFIKDKSNILVYKSSELTERKDSDAAPARQPQKATPSKGGKTYIVKSGDSLGRIATKHGVTVAEIKKWNNMKSNTIHPGQKLVIKK
ncbi:MAG: transglycosylase SLT domain-containing protein [Prevotellaceae bacterium]|jgi:membrane-bound lytic murein transglycosylase D|nr:transglycosylase SLT domain-containing protein [Prevotellaceae bacterium]